VVRRTAHQAPLSETCDVTLEVMGRRLALHLFSSSCPRCKAGQELVQLERRLHSAATTTGSHSCLTSTAAVRKGADASPACCEEGCWGVSSRSSTCQHKASIDLGDDQGALHCIRPAQE
jgi:hypothetical protein